MQQLAAHYVKVYGFDDVLHLMVQHYRDEAISSWVGRTRRTRAEMSQAWDRLVQPELDARFGAFIDGMTQVVARNFDADDLRTMIAFEESDIGTKLRAVRPKVQDEMFDLERRVLSGALSSAINQHTEELRKLGLNYSQ